METKKPTLTFRIIQGILHLFYPRITPEGTENIPQEPVIFVSNHCQMHGPIIGQFYMPGKPYIWCAGQMMHLKEVPRYAYQDFWGYKKPGVQWFYKLLSYLIAPLSVCIFNNARTIGVYHDARIISTFKKTVETLSAGENILIFPEHDQDHNHILCDFQDKFLDVARLYYKRTGKALSFVPVYTAPKLRKVVVGKPMPFDPTQEMEAQRKQICDALMDEITALACAQPKHKVVTYRNLPQRLYPFNKE